MTLTALFRPRGIAVIGASTDPAKLGGAMATNIASYDGHVALVNPRGGEGMFSSVADAAASGPIDLAVICVPASACATVVNDCGAAGVGAALVCAGGFAEVGAEGAGHQEALLEAVRRHGLRLLGPNTSGFFAPGRGLHASFVPGVASLPTGGVGIVAASGGLNHALAFAFQREGVGLSLGVGIGAGIDVAAHDVLDFLASDPATTAIALHLETVTDGRALLAAVHHAAAIKPVVALVVGQHDIGDFARSHTGALATSWHTTRALLRQSGAVIVDDVEAMVTATSVLSRARLSPRPTSTAALVTAQAGPGLMIADAAHAAGVSLPELSTTTLEQLSSLLPPMTYQANPVDTGRPGPTHAQVVTAVAEDPAIDMLAVYAIAEPVVDLVDSVGPAHSAGATVVIGTDGPPEDLAKARARAAEAGIPLVAGPRAVGVALSALAEDAAARSRWVPDPRTRVLGKLAYSVARPPVTDLPADLTEHAAKELLETVGIACPHRRLVSTEEEALAALTSVGAPVAVKISSTAITHKSDIGGVCLNVASPDDMERAFRRIEDLAGQLGHSVELLVEEMAAPGVDLLASARRDPVFGTVVVVGVGGLATEVYGDFAVSAWPSPVSLTSLPDQLSARGLLDGHRGSPAVDRAALADTLAALGELVDSNPQLAEVEINPLRATAAGLIALDAVVLAQPPLHRSDHR